MSALLRFFVSLPRSLFQATLIYLPGEAGILLRRWYYRSRLRACGKNLTILPGVHIDGLQWIEIGDDVTIRENALIRAGAGPRHDPREILSVGRSAGGGQGMIRIGRGSSIAFGAVLLGYGGIAIGEKCGIGPYSVLLSETFHHKGRQLDRVYKYSQGADPEEQCVLRGYIEMQDGAGIASNVLVLPGATVGCNAWVAPNSVVRLAGTVESDVIAKGDPAGTVFYRPYTQRTRAT